MTALRLALTLTAVLVTGCSTPSPSEKQSEATLRVHQASHQRLTLLLRDDQGRLVWTTDMAPANIERGETTNARGEIEGSAHLLDTVVFSVRVPDFADGRLTLSVDPATLPPSDPRSLSGLQRVDVGTVRLPGIRQ